MFRWDGISAIYSDKDAPVRVALEMRLTGDSNIILAPQRGNENGTISIEVLTTLITPDKTWQNFNQKIADIWNSYTGENGNKLNDRPHWAKEWSGLRVHGKEVEQYFKEDAYYDAFKEFRMRFGAILKARDVTLADTLDRFGTETMKRLIFEQ
ncbi:MAG TPA: D-arabinono-1,4-lactone oxidase [Chlamydiales bacterium]|nr:D-arabinono-1,4-lactone oxidase [Chlamydiales bacterium]